MKQLSEGLYNLGRDSLWLIKVDGSKYLYVGSETDARLNMNDLAAELNDFDLNKAGMRKISVR